MGLLVQSDMATPVIADLGTRDQIAEFLTPAIRGEKVAALGVSEPNAGSDVAGIQTWLCKLVEADRTLTSPCALCLRVLTGASGYEMMS